jgi:hypothetical protein
LRLRASKPSLRLSIHDPSPGNLPQRAVVCRACDAYATAEFDEYVAVVDNDESLRRSLSRFLRAGHFQPIAYESAEAFLADTKNPKLDCLVLDIQLKTN